MDKKIAIYIRVSTHYQIDKDSLPLQKKDLVNYSKFVLNTKKYEIFSDAGYSGKNTKRPAYSEMMSRIKNDEFSHLLVWKIDRISRNLVDFCNMYDELKKHNCIFISKNEQFDTSTAMGEAMLKIILVFAELERKITSERVTAVMLERANNGFWNGGPIPYGYKKSPNSSFPEIEPYESDIVKQIYDVYIKTKSTTSVLNYLTSNKIKTKRNGNWSTKVIGDILKNPFYKGTLRYNFKESGNGKKKDKSEWIIKDNTHKPLIDPDVWEKCNSILDENSSKNSAKFRSNKKTHVFAGLLLCKECGRNLTAKEDKARRNGFRPSAYICPGHYYVGGSCTQKTVSDTKIGTFVINLTKNLITISKRISSPSELEKHLLNGKCFEMVVGIENIEDIYNSLHNNIKHADITFLNENSDSIEQDQFVINNLKQEQVKYNRALERLEDLYLFDEANMSNKDYVLKKNKLISKLDDINKKILSLNVNSSSSSNDLKFISAAATSLLNSDFKTKSYINYDELLLDYSKETMKDFMNQIIDSIETKDKLIYSVKFKNGLNFSFIYSL